MTNAADESFMALFNVRVIPGVNQAGDVKIKGWILDSGCTAHLCSEESKFKQLDTSPHGQIKLANKGTSEIRRQVLYDSLL